jgi:ABC-type polysaccharide/polyol phosphate transport system ATPase subunit
MWLSHGRVAQIGTVKEVLQAYREMSPSLVGENSAV